MGDGSLGSLIRRFVDAQTIILHVEWIWPYCLETTLLLFLAISSDPCTCRKLDHHDWRLVLKHVSWSSLYIFTRFRFNECLVLNVKRWAELLVFPMSFLEELQHCLSWYLGCSDSFQKQVGGCRVHATFLNCYEMLAKAKRMLIGVYKHYSFNFMNCDCDYVCDCVVSFTQIDLKGTFCSSSYCLNIEDTCNFSDFFSIKLATIVCQLATIVYHHYLTYPATTQWSMMLLITSVTFFWRWTSKLWDVTTYQSYVISTFLPISSNQVLLYYIN